MKKVLFFFTMMWCMCMTAFGQDANDELGHQTDLEFTKTRRLYKQKSVMVDSWWKISRTKILLFAKLSIILQKKKYNL